MTFKSCKAHNSNIFRVSKSIFMPNSDAENVYEEDGDMYKKNTKVEFPILDQEK